MRAGRARGPAGPPDPMGSGCRTRSRCCRAPACSSSPPRAGAPAASERSAPRGGRSPSGWPGTSGTAGSRGGRRGPMWTCLRASRSRPRAAWCPADRIRERVPRRTAGRAPLPLLGPGRSPRRKRRIRPRAHLPGRFSQSREEREGARKQGRRDGRGVAACVPCEPPLGFYAGIIAYPSAVGDRPAPGLLSRVLRAATRARLRGGRGRRG